MLERFSQNNQAENIRRWLEDVDLSSADILQTEREIYAALTKANKKDYWLATPVAPLAEPVDMNALVGDLFTGANQEILYHVGRMDDFYSWLSETNNVLKSEIESVEKAVTQATDDIQDISIVIGDENRNFYWVSDSFNNNTYVDLTKSSCLVDTDYGMVTLGPKQLQAITDFEALIDRQTTKGIPGANLYIVNPGKFGIATKEPEPTLEKTDTRNFGTIFDLDPSSWFEVERNFIPPTQKLKMQGRAFVYSESGEEKNVKEVTADLDWTAIVEWPDGYQDGGPDGKGKSLVEWRNLEKESSVLSQAISQLVGPQTGTDLNPDACLAFNLNLKVPTSLSAIKLLPFIRDDGAPITIQSLDVVADGNIISVAKDIELGTNRSTTRLQREILRRTGVQLVGSVFSIPTDRDISEIRVVLTSKPISTKHGFGHIFKDVLTEYRTERNHVLWRSVNKWKDWGRVKYNENVPKLTSSYSRPAIVGTLMGAGQAAHVLGTAWNSAAAAAKLAGTAFKVGGTLGSAGAWLGRAVPWIGAILALDQLVGGFFSINKSSAVLEAKVGFDVFKGHRSAVGLRDVTLVKTIYENESVVQSIKREFPGYVSKIGLFVDEYIPEHWGAGDWITYYVSVDGTNWKSIPKLADSTLEKSLVLPEPTKTIFFRAIIKGNGSDTYHTPQLRHYALQGLPVG
jgi:hypothetical protein